MSRNEERRARLADAAITVLAAEGARGLTHRAVDRSAGEPPGTTSNYFRSRGELLSGLVGRIGERIAPAPSRVEQLRRLPPGPVSLAAHLEYVVERMTASTDVGLAWLEMRIEAARRPEVASLMTAALRDGFRADVDYHVEVGLPGGAAEVALLHYAVDGLLLDRLTVSIDPGTPVGAVVRSLAEGVAGR